MTPEEYAEIREYAREYAGKARPPSNDLRGRLRALLPPLNRDQRVRLHNALNRVEDSTDNFLAAADRCAAAINGSGPVTTPYDETAPVMPIQEIGGFPVTEGDDPRTNSEIVRDSVPPPAVPRA